MDLDPLVASGGLSSVTSHSGPPGGRRSGAPPARMTGRTSKLAGTAGAAWFALTAWCAPASAQDSSPLHATTLQQAAVDVREAQPDSPPAEGESNLPQHLCWAMPIPIRFAPVLSAPVVLPSPPASAQTSRNPPDEKRSEKPVSYGVGVELGSGHADRGLVISDRPVVHVFAWVSGSVAALSAWSNITLGETTDGSRPQILEMEVTRGHEWRNLTIEPAIRMFFYRDPLSIDSSRSIESWLYLSYHAGPFRLFTNQSVDVLAYKGAYFEEAGIAFERRLSPRVEVGGSFKTGWASSTFNDVYVGIDKSALNLSGVEGWLTFHAKPHLYIRPSFEFSTTVNRAVRAELAHPTLFFMGLVTGVEF
jgi:hypothetical protein